MRDQNRLFLHDQVTAIKDIWHNLVKSGHNGEIVKELETGFNVFFPLSDQYSYQDQIFFVTPDQIQLRRTPPMKKAERDNEFDNLTSWNQ